MINVTMVLYLIFFASGASALIFEALWFKLAALTFGSSVWATAIVLSSFMGGLALGNALIAFKGHKIRYPIRFYAFMEIAIALSGLSLVITFPQLTEFFTPLFRNVSEYPLLLNIVRTIIAFILMLIPSTAMGVTLPLLVKFLYDKNPNFGQVLGSLYGWNTLGALTGVLLNEIYLLKWFGINGAGAIAAGLNLFAAIIAIILFKIIKTEDAQKIIIKKISVYGEFSLKTMCLLAASFLSGFIILASEVIWFRYMILFFAADGWTFAVMLATVLGGISLGGMVASRWFNSQPEAHYFLPIIILFNGILMFFLYSKFIVVLEGFAHYDLETLITLSSLFLMFPVALISGIIFTMLGKALYDEIKSETRATGFLTLANTLGAMSGSIVGLILIPVLGIEKAFYSLALCYALISLLVADKSLLNFSKRNLFFGTTVVLFVVSMIFFPFGLMETRFLAIAGASQRDATEKRVAIREGLSETIQYFRKDLSGKPYYYRMITNNHSMSGTSLIPKRYMGLYVYWFLSVHPNPEKALLICYGCGTTAKAMTDAKILKDIAIVDISKDILELSEVVYPDKSENPLYDPRVTVHVEDGRYFLLTTNQKFDLITAEPPPLKHSGTVNLYTQEYFQLIYNSLSDGGIVTYWLPVYQVNTTEAKSILQAFSNVFPDCSLWTGAGTEWMMVGVKNQQQPVSEKQFNRLWQDPDYALELEAAGLDRPERIGALFIADGKRLKDWIADTPPLIDNYPGRLSYANKNNEKISIPEFIRFMDSDAARKNFMESDGIAKVWPDSLRKKTESYFSVQPVINELFKQPEYKIPQRFPVILHQCITNPMLNNYITWPFQSDLYAMRIIENSNNTDMNSELLNHLAAAEAQKGNFVKAESYLKDFVLLKRSKNEIVTNKIYYYRIYLLFYAGEIQEAEKVVSEYIHYDNANTSQRKKMMEQYWNWLEKNANTENTL